MKATLKFNLDDQAEREAHLCAVKSRDMAIVLFDIANNMLNKIEGEFDSMPPDEYEKISWTDALEKVRTYISDLFEEENINLNELIS